MGQATFNVKLLSVCCLLISFQSRSYAQKTGSWGDQGNGTYINPVLNADYSDPDVIRVNSTYYMVCSEFNYMGMPVLASKDMVNWRIIGQVYHRIDLPDYENMQAYGGGSWAPAIRYHAGRYYVYFCTPAEGLFMSSAKNPAGPWSSLLLVKSTQGEAGWEDPCPFWDKNGVAWLGHSKVGAGPIILHKMSEDGTKLLDSGVTVYTGPVAEGTKIYQVGGYYYISIPEGGVEKGWQTVLRAKNILGPYEKKVVLETGTTSINGPHQGALVTTPNNQWWFYHFRFIRAMGRVLYLEPVYWKDGWPLIGADIDQNGIGEPVTVWQKPDIGRTYPITAPQSDDDFKSPSLGLQWEWNHNPDDSAWSLTEKPGWLALHALKADRWLEARNTLTQKIMGARGEATIILDVAHFAEGEKAGLGIVTGNHQQVGVTMKNSRLYLFYGNGDSCHLEKMIQTHQVLLKVRLDTAKSTCCFYYSMDHKSYQQIGDKFSISWMAWKGPKIALFCYNKLSNNGEALFTRFRYDYDGPKMKGTDD